MHKEVTVALDLRDPLQAQLLADYVASSNPPRWLSQCLLLGYLVATGDIPVAPPPPPSPQEPRLAPEPPPRKPVGGGLFGI